MVAAAAAGLALIAFAAHIWQGISGVYLNHVSGIWLALGRDLAAGLFYRHLISPLGYGGTRYFPLFFTIIGGLLKIGVSPLVAGWTASALAAFVLSTGLARIGRVLGAPRSMVWLLGAAAVAPYFVQQTVLEVRADVLAVGLNLWGLASIISVWRDATDDRRRLVAATTWFVLAFAAKITSLVVPACVVVALILSGRARAGVRLALGLAAGLGLFFVTVQIASDGRALESWRACMFAGSTEGGTLSAMMTGDFLGLVSFSRLLTVLFVLDLVALAALVIPVMDGTGARGAGRDRLARWLRDLAADCVVCRCHRVNGADVVIAGHRAIEPGPRVAADVVGRHRLDGSEPRRSDAHRVVRDRRTRRVDGRSGSCSRPRALGDAQ